MKLLILGATGPTGRELLKQALAAGHSVAALARDPSKITDKIEVIQGDAKDPATIANAVRGRDAILSALGTGKSFKDDVVVRAAANLVAANVKRLIFVSAFGVGESFAEASLLQKLFFMTLLRIIYFHKAIADTTIQRSSLEWTIVRPVILTDGPRTGSYRAGEHLELSAMPKISRADVADFMIRELAERKWNRKTVVLAA